MHRPLILEKESYLFDLGQNVRGLQNKLFFSADLDGGARVLVVDHSVFCLDLDGFIITDSNDDPFLGLS